MSVDCELLSVYVLQEENIDHFLASLKLPQNCLVICPCARGYKAHRNSIGSWLIKTLSDEAKQSENKDELDFLTLLTKVTDVVSDMETRAFLKEGTVEKDYGKENKKEEKTKKKKKTRKIDKKKSGCKSAVTIYHTLLEPVVFRIPEKDSAVGGEALSIPVPNI